MLDSIARTADPQQCYNLNSRMAERIKSQLRDDLPLEKQILIRFKLGEQLLYAGKTEAAIVKFSEVIQMFGGQLTEQTKLIYELLAVSYLRLGEQQNCIDRHTAESCILPVQGQGVYQFRSGPENAIQVYIKILEVFPDDLQSRWLLNLAYMNLGEYPAGVPKKWLVPQSAFRAKGDLRFRDVAIPLGLDVLGLSGGVCMEDFDGDGNLDLFVTSYGLTDQVRYFKNNGDGTFAERTIEANLAGIVSGLNTLHADYDNDGDRDILVLRGGWLDGGTHPNSLLQNDGTGKFTDVTEAAGLLSFHPTQTAGWADYDADGDLDLYIANESKRDKAFHPNELYRNNGDGTFTDVAGSLGVNFQGFFKGVTWGDVNGDRLPDLYLSNISGSNKLLMNRGGRFEDIAERVGVNQPLMSFPTWFFDYDNDGKDDLLVAGYNLQADGNVGGVLLQEYLGQQPKGDWLRLFRNVSPLPASPQGGGVKFIDVSQSAGMTGVSFAMGCNFGDLDNDGWPDLYLGTGTPDLRSLLPNRMYRNVQGKKFEEVTMNGFAHIQKGHGIAFGDIDNDGDQDVYSVMGGAYEGDLSNNVLFENPGTPGNNWISIELVGKTCNRDAIGSKIAVHTVQQDGSKRTIWTTVNTGGSFGSASLRQEIGLGKAVSIEAVEVVWVQPGPAVSRFPDVPMNQHFRAVEGSGSLETIEKQQIKFVN